VKGCTSYTCHEVLVNSRFRGQRRGPAERLGHKEHIVAILRATADREGKRLDQGYAIVFQMRDGKVHAAWEVWKDQPSVDEFWS
jgi:ketosteroid isomerase-like protein